MNEKPEVVLVTGGGSGIGRELVRLFVASGARVVVADLVQGELDTLHGKPAFDTFKHFKTVYTQGRTSMLGLFSPSYKNKHHRLLNFSLGKVADGQIR